MFNTNRKKIKRKFIENNKVVSNSYHKSINICIFIEFDIE